MSVQECSAKMPVVTAVLIENSLVAKGLWKLRVEAPEIASTFLPGQFAMLRIADRTDPLIGRALAVYNAGSGNSIARTWIELVYQVKGRMTTQLARMVPGQRLQVWGPLGNAFNNQPVDHLVMVAGGIGQTPFLSLAREALGLEFYGSTPRANRYAKNVHLLYGARSADYFAGLDEFRATGLNLELATDDGSIGPPRRVTDLLLERLRHLSGQSVRVVCCGPEPMMEAVAEITHQQQVPCEVSLETPMACGIGICFTCVAKVKQSDGSWDYKRTCVEGPIFPANDVVW
jgi:dihydroorotate dehydrogenase electron transfer subunit